MSFRQLRKIPGLSGIVKDLAEQQNRAQAEDGVEDLTEFGQNRVDTDAIAFTDTDSEILNGDKVDSDNVALSDTDSESSFTSGQFRVDGYFQTDEPYCPEAPAAAVFDRAGFETVAPQPAVADFGDAG
ncbi:MAG: hypothetical protein AB1753_01140 [Thermoproteota archaeon]